MRLPSRLQTLFTKRKQVSEGKKGSVETTADLHSLEEEAWEKYHIAIADDFNPLTDVLIVPTKIQWLMERSPYKRLVQGRIIYMDNVVGISTIRAGGGQRPLRIPMPTVRI